MNEDIFRFVSLRAPQRGVPDQTSAPIDIYLLAGGATKFLDQLRKLVSSGTDRRGLVSHASAHLPSFATELPIKLRPFDQWLLSMAARPIRSSVLQDAIQETLGLDARALIESKAFLESAGLVADRLVAHALGAGQTSEQVQGLIASVRLLGLIALADAPDGKKRTVLVRTALRRPVCLPADVFVPWGTAVRDGRPHEDRSRAVKEHRSSIEDSLGTLEQLERTANELGELIRKGLRGKGLQSRVELARIERVVEQASATLASSELTTIVREELIEPVSPLVVPELSAAARSVLDARKLDPDRAGTVEIFERIEQEMRALGRSTFASGTDGRAVALGRGPSVIALPPFSVLPGSLTLPGACPPCLPESPSASKPTVPIGVGVVRAIGVADLMLTRQRLLRHEAGDIAYIENVLQSELRERVHRRSVVREEEVVTESELTEDTTRDLSSNERFELQREAEQVLRTDTQFETSLTVSSSYGPVSAEASMRFARNTSREDASRSATGFAREITSRSVSRIQRRTLERRVVRTVNETEESNTHRFDNQAGSDHVVGVYRWVDAVFEARVVNYGRRLILEVLVPEPSAFWHHARTVTPLEGVSLRKPIPPGFCLVDREEFLPLSPDRITESNYQYFIGRYAAKDVPPPPARFQTIGMAFEQSYSGTAEAGHCKATDVLAVPAGYAARRAWVAGGAIALDVPDRSFNIYVGRKRVVNATAELDRETGTLPIAAVGFYVQGYAFNIEVLCERTAELFAKWQHNTYASVMAAYEDQRAVYERELETKRASGDGLPTSALANRQVIERELRRESITMLSGQHFEAFDAMRRDVAPNGYPEVDLAEAEAEAPFVSFFEEAFDWRNMSYRFFPYHWARKDRWPLLATLDETDPLFANFLRAGAARVRIPVTIGFEEAVVHYFETGGNLPSNSDVVHVLDDNWAALIQEVQDARGEDVHPGIGLLDVENDSIKVSAHGADLRADDEQREILIAGQRHVITRVESPELFELDRPYEGPTAQGVGYSVGVKLVGSPWEIRVPTSLVTLRPSALTNDG